MRAWITFMALGVVAACASTENSVARLAGEAGDGRIMVQFLDFPQGSTCTVQTPKGALIVNKMPGEIEYPALYSASPVTCTTPQGRAYAVDVESSLPAGASVAGFSVYPDGRVIGTISAGETLTNTRNEIGVRRLN